VSYDLKLRLPLCYLKYLSDAKLTASVIDDCVCSIGGMILTGEKIVVGRKRILVPLHSS